MRVRTVLVLTSVVSMLAGAVVLYLVITVPNDLRADSILKSARRDLTAGNQEAAKKSLTQIVQQYPRTNAAAAATVALVQIGDQERDKLTREVARLEGDNKRQGATLADLQRRVNTIEKTPPPAPPPAPVVKPAAKKAPTRTVTKKRPTPKKKTTTRKKRR